MGTHSRGLVCYKFSSLPIRGPLSILPDPPEPTPTLGSVQLASCTQLGGVASPPFARFRNVRNVPIFTPTARRRWCWAPLLPPPGHPWRRYCSPPIGTDFPGPEGPGT